MHFHTDDLDRVTPFSGKACQTGGRAADPSLRAMAIVRAYWEALRRPGMVPARADINPRGLETALDQTFLLERIAPGLARFRLAGRLLHDLMGMEVRGLPISSLITPGFRETLAGALETVFEGPAVADIHLTARREIGRPPLTGRLLILPLRSDAGEVSRALGCLATEGAIGRTPRRFDIAAVQTCYLDGSPAQHARPVAPAFAEPAFAETPAPFEPAKRSPARPHLRLVKTDR